MVMLLRWQVIILFRLALHACRACRSNVLLSACRSGGIVLLRSGPLCSLQLRAFQKPPFEPSEVTGVVGTKPVTVGTTACLPQGERIPSTYPAWHM